MQYFRHHSSIEVGLLVCNRKEAGAFSKAEAAGVPSHYISKTTFRSEPEEVADLLRAFSIDCIALAGFLLLLPGYIVQLFSGKILNIHPALLPEFGGPGMYGNNVHEAVKLSGKTETGLTIHEVDEAYDRGRIVFQANCPVFLSDEPGDIAARVLRLEHAHYPFVIEQFIHSIKSKRAKTNA